jgi:hypothetical protein
MTGKTGNETVTGCGVARRPLSPGSEGTGGAVTSGLPFPTTAGDI